MCKPSQAVGSQGPAWLRGYEGQGAKTEPGQNLEDPLHQDRLGARWHPPHGPDKGVQEPGKPCLV